MPSKNSVNKAKNLQKYQHASRAASTRLRRSAKLARVIDPTSAAALSQESTSTGAIVGTTRAARQAVRGGRVSKTVEKGGIVYGRVPSRKVQQKLVRRRKLAARAEEAAAAEVSGDEADEGVEEEELAEVDEEMEVDDAAPTTGVASLFGGGVKVRSTTSKSRPAAKTPTGKGTEIGAPRR
ncbi:hypothetical protein BCR37DRAFT_404150 [Protomyces lactucae-debilis]|uniref:Uncharacterized protein n=1 Tax=Protomyces lactucae-debilis TaxID=2754530 RepID=A0A1Y2FV34_PROLT|nr:uncharacterized protein BCR37DRAFT_404150 [Protomyces lactucae-debilis]ORY87873.1 hypothetical protein BCR37DRAFT_404150 [Protomyces lactucae-debilis]